MTTDPSSPAVGVNVGAVDQTVTFADGQSQATLTVPILAGAPNPGEVDVNLTITPIDPTRPTSRSWRSVGSEDRGVGSTLPPKVVSVDGHNPGNRAEFQQTDEPGRGLQREELRAALDVVTQQIQPPRSGRVTLALEFAQFLYLGVGAAQVRTIRPRDQLGYSHSPRKAFPRTPAGTQSSITVTQGHPAKNSGRPGKQSNVGPGLTDLEGNPINADSTPGKFNIDVFSGQLNVFHRYWEWDSCYRPIAELPLIIVIRTASMTLTALTCDNPPGARRQRATPVRSLLCTLDSMSLFLSAHVPTPHDPIAEIQRLLRIDSSPRANAFGPGARLPRRAKGGLAERLPGYG